MYIIINLEPMIPNTTVDDITSAPHVFLKFNPHNNPMK